MASTSYSERKTGRYYYIRGRRYVCISYSQVRKLTKLMQFIEIVQLQYCDIVSWFTNPTAFSRNILGLEYLYGSKFPPSPPPVFVVPSMITKSLCRVIEINTGLICSCIPAIKPFFRYLVSQGFTQGSWRSFRIKSNIFTKRSMSDGHDNGDLPLVRSRDRSNGTDLTANTRKPLV